MSLDVHDTTRTAQIATRPSLLDAVRDLRRAAESTRFPVELAGTSHARDSRARLVDQLDGHLIPRLVQLSAPAVVVVAGSTGAGKSTLVNSILATEVSPAGVLRPTTRRPVLVHHPLDAELLAEHPLTGTVDVVQHAQVPRGLALLDAPDLDSLLEPNRRTAHRLLEAADLWLFVTTASRYGDALPWAVLERAQERGVSMAVVLNRVPVDVLGPVRSDLLTRLREHGMSSVPMFVVPDAGPHEGLLDADVVAPILRWLAMLAGPDRARAVILRTLRGALLGLRPWVDDLAEAVQAQVDGAQELRRAVRSALEAPAEQAARAVVDHAVADGEVHARWEELTALSGGLDGLVRRGRVRRAGVRRRRRHRGHQLGLLAQDLERSVVATFCAAASRGANAATRTLQAADAPDGAKTLLEAQGGVTAPGSGQHAGPVDQPVDQVELRSARARESASDWLVTAEQSVRHLLEYGQPARRSPVAQAVRAVGLAGVATIALAAAAGVTGAGTMLSVLLGDQADPVQDRLRADLASRVREQVSAEGESMLEPLDDPDLAPDTAAVLRVRLAVLKDVS